MTLTTYDVNVYREGKWWMVAIPAIDGLTQARRLADVLQAAQEYVAVTLDVPMSDVHVNCASIKTDHVDVGPAIDDIEAAREEAAKAEERAARSTRWLIAELRSDEVPMRDIAAVLGLSYQRVGQIANAHA